MKDRVVIDSWAINYLVGHIVRLHVGQHVHPHVGHHVSHHVSHHVVHRNVVSTLCEISGTLPKVSRTEGRMTKEKKINLCIKYNKYEAGGALACSEQF